MTSQLKIYYNDGTTHVFEREGFVLFTDVTNDPNTRPGEEITAACYYDDSTDFSQVTWLKEELDVNNDKIITRVEWLKNNFVIAYLDGVIYYNWKMSETPQLQEMLTFVTLE